MRVGVLILFGMVATVLRLWADESLAVLKVGTDVYSNVTITAVTPTDIYFTYNKGMANAKLKNLDPALQQHFKFDAASAAAGEAQQQAANLPATAAEGQTIDRKTAQSIMDVAIARVKAIVNQPVRQLARTPDMRASTSSPGWFHQGAIKPDFSTVDVRATQDTQADQRPYVTSDLNPGVVFVGAETEFNPMTKYFYVDRSLPKKKLTEAEMVEINRLYRVIGKCEESLLPPSAMALSFVSLHKNALVIAAISLGALLLVIRVLTGRRME